MTYFRIKGDDGAHEVLQALVSTWKPVGHVQPANPGDLRPESLEINPPVSPVPLSSDHGSTNVAQEPVPTRILESPEGS